MRILGIETSCDDTAVGIVKYAQKRFTIEAQVTASQVLTHRKYGGVVPEVAAREHAVTILPTLQAALRRAKVSWRQIDAIAVTGGPGLNTALLVGVEAARTIAYLHTKRLIRVNHIEGHLVSSWIQPEARAIRFPAVALIVSGGHTELIVVSGFGKYRLLGKTIDDAVGEAFDKTAKVLGLPYPGGPEISGRALRGNPQNYRFPRALMQRGNFDFSYAGLKTSVLYTVQKMYRRGVRVTNDICASFQAAALEPLITKTSWALARVSAKSLLLGGGVAANHALRAGLAQMVQTDHPNVLFVQPPLELCTDNGVMIAMAGTFQALKNNYTPWERFVADPNWELVSA